ncbi:unnamed protein product [Prorocentrum cordatum]|uniref:Uncharacterized protein n=1 Tax=Prorocentrum cordatum TaxID=2364126 RepID=A0ABN9TVT8_9DINO|nr:unnamed protein product [Polarella glacialis]
MKSWLRPSSSSTTWATQRTPARHGCLRSCASRQSSHMCDAWMYASPPGKLIHWDPRGRWIRISLGPLRPKCFHVHRLPRSAHWVPFGGGYGCIPASQRGQPATPPEMAQIYIRSSGCSSWDVRVGIDAGITAAGSPANPTRLHLVRPAIAWTGLSPRFVAHRPLLLERRSPPHPSCEDLPAAASWCIYRSLAEDRTVPASPRAPPLWRHPRAPRWRLAGWRRRPRGSRRAAGSGRPAARAARRWRACAWSWRGGGGRTTSGDLRRAQVAVYRELAADQAAAQSFLREEGVQIEDMVGLRPRVALRRLVRSAEPDDEWHVAVRSAPLELAVERVVVQALSFKDQGWGNSKGRIGLALLDAGGALMTRCDLFGTYRSPGYAYGDSPQRALESDEEVVARAVPGCSYRLEYVVGGGGGHSVSIVQLLCKIYPAGWTEDLASHRLRDPEGDAGLYLGPVDGGGRAHGEGRLEYDDGDTFVGGFEGGSLREGVLYGRRGREDLMLQGTWVQGTPPPGSRQALRQRYPREADWLVEEPSFPAGFDGRLRRGDSDGDEDENEVRFEDDGLDDTSMASST